MTLWVIGVFGSEIIRHPVPGVISKLLDPHPSLNSFPCLIDSSGSFSLLHPPDPEEPECSWMKPCAPLVASLLPCEEDVVLLCGLMFALLVMEL